VTDVFKLQVYVSTLKLITGPVVAVQETAAAFGSVIAQLTDPPGTTALTTPVTVVVRIVVPPRVGFGEAAKVIVGNCLDMVKVIGVLVTVE
jgi:hypothetical protein